MKFKILQIMPSGGKKAVYEYLDSDDGDFKKGNKYKFDLVGFALVEWEEGEDSYDFDFNPCVHGLITNSIGRIVLAEFLDETIWNFLDYE